MKRIFPFKLLLPLGLICCLALQADDEAGKIMRPTNGAAIANGQVDIIATAPSGKLELDGKPIEAAQPFPNVLHANLKTSPGPHTLSLSWDGGKKEIRFFTGPNAPPEFSTFHEHPPLAGIQCTQCHELSPRGRFRFKGGCFDCHKKDGFAKVHTHDAAVLEQCGTCHNAHGTTVKAHLLYPKETACKLCHN
jgi:predicted CXXCH cytochrome family protein